jgi:hypothetical protein
VSRWAAAAPVQPRTPMQYQALAIGRILLDGFRCAELDGLVLIATGTL